MPAEIAVITAHGDHSGPGQMTIRFLCHGAIRHESHVGAMHEVAGMPICVEQFQQNPPGRWICDNLVIDLSRLTS